LDYTAPHPLVYSSLLASSQLMPSRSNGRRRRWTATLQRVIKQRPVHLTSARLPASARRLSLSRFWAAPTEARIGRGAPPAFRERDREHDDYYATQVAIGNPREAVTTFFFLWLPTTRLGLVWYGLKLDQLTKSSEPKGDGCQPPIGDNTLASPVTSYRSGPVLLVPHSSPQIFTLHLHQ
jgi:hypothetical protein